MIPYQLTVNMNTSRDEIGDVISIQHNKNFIVDSGQKSNVTHNENTVITNISKSGLNSFFTIPIKKFMGLGVDRIIETDANGVYDIYFSSNHLFERVEYIRLFISYNDGSNYKELEISGDLIQYSSQTLLRVNLGVDNLMSRDIILVKRYNLLFPSNETILYDNIKYQVLMSFSVRRN